MGVKTEFKRAGRIELDFGGYTKCVCVVLAETYADITAMARGWLSECPSAKKVTAYYGLSDVQLVCYVREEERGIKIIGG